MLLLALLATTTHAWCGEATLGLPQGESPGEWSAALNRQGLEVGAGGVRVTVEGTSWRLAVNTPAGRREAVVPAPRTEHERDVVAALAAALLAAGPSVAPPMARQEPRAWHPPGETSVQPPTMSALPAPQPQLAQPAVASMPQAPPVAAPPTVPAAPSAVALAPAPSPPTPARAAAPATSPSAPPPPSPAAPTLQSTRPPSPARSPLRLRAGLGGGVLLRSGLEPAALGALDAEVVAGSTWFGAELSVATPTAVTDAAALTWSQAGLRGGAAVYRAGRMRVDAGVGLAGQLWFVEDRLGTHQALGLAAEALVRTEVRLGDALSLGLGVVVAGEFQPIEVLGDALAPGPVTVRPVLSIRGGR